MEDYIVESDQLMPKGEFEEPEERTIARYLSRLNYEIAYLVNLQPFFSLYDVMKLALKVEKQNKARGAIKSEVYRETGFRTQSAILETSSK